MNSIVNKDILVAAGIDYDDGVRRFAGRAELYEKFLVKIVGRDDLDKLKVMLEQKDYHQAFILTHTMKGEAGNLSMQRFYVIICEIVEELRNGEPKRDLLPLYQEACQAYAVASAAIEQELTAK